MSSPYNDLSIVKHELVRNPQELLLAGYNDYQRLRQLEGEIRALYPEYLDKLGKLKKDSALQKEFALQKTYQMKIQCQKSHQFIFNYLKLKELF